MEKKFVIDPKNLPQRRTPVMMTLVAFMAIEIWSLADIWQGVIYTFLVIMWIGFIYAKFTVDETNVDIFNEKKLRDVQIKEKQ